MKTSYAEKVVFASDYLTISGQEQPETFPRSYAFYGTCPILPANELRLTPLGGLVISSIK